MRNPHYHLWDPDPDAIRFAGPYLNPDERAIAAELDKCRWQYPDGHVCGQQKGADDHTLSVIPDAAEEPRTDA